MASAKKNLIGTAIVKSLGGGCLDLNLRWNEKGTHWRLVAAETFRIAARICEASRDARWCIDPHADCGLLGRGLLGTYIRIELADGTEAEMALAEAMLRKVATDIKG